ncbi:FecR family protein [Sphingobacterium pedocola]|uniref:Anti-sigma factor n=1 Tax=Sphingobacterium pedocola TaxID=2082722 RepID=A0ABR9T3K6_9SPHI|nr:FecR family protein [Sphingobacterium pedocola]MBE8719257.1 anti-sigma factor [Sphingobacterium pedocola]
MKERVNYLLKQYFYNRANRQELDELFAIIRSAEYDEDIALLIKELYEQLRRDDPSLTYIDDMGKLWESPHAADLPPTFTEKEISLPRRRSVTVKMYLSVAACALLLLLAGLLYQHWPITNHSEVQIIKHAAPDENKVILLADGTKVWVNSSSQLQYPQEFKRGQPREVTLIGEAYFEVEHAENWPFIVHTGDVQTKVLGTKFNVKAYPNMKEIQVSVKTGKVMVSKRNETLATLIQNQELNVPARSTTTFRTVKEKELKSKVVGSWTSGYLEYEDEPIAAVIADIERFYRVEIRLDRASLRDEIITLSVLKESDPAYVLEVLATLTDTAIKIENKKYVIF